MFSVYSLNELKCEDLHQGVKTCSSWCILQPESFVINVCYFIRLGWKNIKLKCVCLCVCVRAYHSVFVITGRVS